jgi:hypothetical protein
MWVKRRSTRVRTTLWNDFLLHDRRETFTLSNVSSSSSSYTGAIKGSKGVTTLFTMIKFLTASTKTKKVSEIIWYLHSKRVDTFYLTN